MLYPITPSLYNLIEGRLGEKCKQALTRIFRIFDVDTDGLLSDSELNMFQYHVFNSPLVEGDIAGWKKVVSKNSSMSRSANEQTDPVVHDGKFTVAGFLSIFDLFICQNRLEIPWGVLRTFGYDDDLDLHIPEDILDDQGWKLSTSAMHWLSSIFYQFDGDSDGVLEGNEIKGE